MLQRSHGTGYVCNDVASGQPSPVLLSRRLIRTPAVDGHAPLSVRAAAIDVDALADVSRDRARLLVGIG